MFRVIETPSFSEVIKEKTDHLIKFPDLLFNESFSLYRKELCVLFSSQCPDDNARLLSNHAPCELVVNGRCFNSVEQLYFVLRFFQFPHIQKELMRYNGFQVKNIARQYLHLLPSETDGYKANLLMYCLRLKVKQNSRINQYLESKVSQLVHKNKTITFFPYLVEYCSYWTDTKNGTIDVDSSLRGKWKEGVVTGQNRCGKMLLKAFKEYRNGLLDEPFAPPYDFLKLFGKDIELA